MQNFKKSGLDLDNDFKNKDDKKIVNIFTDRFWEKILSAKKKR